jgi:8-oxo-dGTP diphosphatase
VTSVLLRHAAAGDRDRWDGDDFHRPLDSRGRSESEALVELLRPFGLRRVVSSPYARCFQTVEPLAAALGLSLELDDRLGEGEGRAALDLVQEDGLVMCTHGDVVRALVDCGLKKAAAVVLEDGAVVRQLPPPKI